MQGLPTDVVPDEIAYSLYEGVEYQNFWHGKDKSKLDLLEHAIVRDLLPSSGKYLIDVGCGYGRLAASYLDRFEEVVFFDGSMSLLHQAQKNNGGIGSYIAGDIKRMPFHEAAFDCVHMVRVFHHFEDSRGLLKDLQRILCKHGKLIFTYHNKRNLRRMIKWTLRLDVDPPFAVEPSGKGTTLISHHPKFVRDLLSEMDFTDIEYRGAGLTDKFVPMIGRMGRFVPIGMRIAPILGHLKLTPWIFCSANREYLPPQPDVRSIDDLLICPVCGGDLRMELNSYTCKVCNLFFPCNNGIIDFRIDPYHDQLTMPIDVG